LPGGFPPLPGAQKDPGVVARELVNGLSDALVKQLTEAGFPARRLGADAPLPGSGWLLRGVFAHVDQGNQLTRAMIGFGAGKTGLQILVDVSDLADGTPRLFYELTSTGDSGRAPGSAPMIALCPAGAAARFVLAGDDLKRNVRQTAAKIAAEVVQRTQRGL
jgi:hypothetical protein